MNRLNNIRRSIFSITYVLTAAVTLVVLGGFLFINHVYAESLYSNTDVVLDVENNFASEEIDVSSYENLVFSFDYEAEGIDNGDSFTYGWSSGGDENTLGTVNGINNGPDGDETGSVSISVDAQVEDLVLYINLDLDSSGEDDIINITNIQLTGDEVSPAALIGDTEYETIEDALTAAASMDPGVIIEVQSGTYSGFEVDVESVTLEGNGATIEGQITVSAPNVTINDFVVTNPTAGYGIVVKGVSGVSITNNTLEDIGTSHGSNTAQAIYVSGEGAEADFGGIVISDNEISGVGHSTAKTSKAIYIGDSQVDVTLTSIEITDNEISNISANNTAWVSGGAGGQGAYGITTNLGYNADGSTEGLVITGNTLTDLSGLWVHAIGLEGDTPNAVVSANDISDLRATKGDTVDTSAFRDEVGVFFEGNTSAPTVDVSGNSFSDMYYGVYVHPNLDLGEDTVLADGNWWGDATGPHGTGVLIGDGVTVNAWLDAPEGESRNHNVIVGAATYLSIQEAIDAETTVSGGIVEVLNGTYEEQIAVNKEITLEGDGDTSEGTTIYVVGAGDAIDITANNVTLRDIRVEKDDNGKGVEIVGASVSNITLDGITITGTINGLRIGSGVTLDGLIVTDSHFDGNEIGWYFSHESSQGTTVTNVEVTDSTFNNNTRKGIYVEKLENALFDGIEVSNSGTDSSYNFNNGIDVNLKWGAYENIEIRNATVTGSGLMGPSSPFDPAGIAIKARDDGSYASPGATLTGVTLTNVTVSGGVVGVRFGEDGKNNVGPSDVTVTSSSLQGTGGIGLSNTTQGQVNAIKNYWGTDSSDISDIEDKTEGDVTVTPWYTDEDLTKLQYKTTANVDGNNETTTTEEVTSSTDSGNATLTVDSGTTITGSDSWNGNIILPTTVAAEGDAPTGFNVGSTVIRVGSETETLLLSQPAQLVLEGVTGTVGYRPAGGNWVQITTVCAGANDHSNIVAHQECAIVDGGDTIIWTYHFTDFGSLVAVSASGGGSFSVNTSNDDEEEEVAEEESEDVEETDAPQGRVLGAEIGYLFNANLSIGTRGTDVVELQERLRAEGFFTFHTSTGYFGPITQAAVIAYQSHYRISPAVGFVGPITRGHLNSNAQASTQVSTRVSILEQLNAILEQALLIQERIAQL